MFFVPGNPQSIYIVQPTSDYMPFLYALIPFGLVSLCCCCTLFFVAAYIYKQRIQQKKEEKGIQAKEEAPPTTETVSVDPDIIQIRSVEEPKTIKNVFTKPRFVTRA